MNAIRYRRGLWQVYIFAIAIGLIQYLCFGSLCDEMDGKIIILREHYAE